MKTHSLLVLPVLFALSTFAAEALDWYRWRGPDLDGISKESGWQTTWPKEGPKQLWKAAVGIGFSSMSVSNGRVYTMGNEKDTETVFCFDANTGELRWKHSYPCPIDPHVYEGGPNATPTVDGKQVYTFSRKGHLFAFDAETGNVIWSKNVHDELGLKIPEWGLSSSVLVEGDLLIINAGVAGSAVNKTTGKVVWTSGKESAGYSTPVPVNQGSQLAVALFSTTELEAVSVADGKLLWTFPWKTKYGVNAADPIINGDNIFISSGYNEGCALLKVSGNKPSVVWQNKNMRNHFNSSVLIAGNIYGFDEADLKCLDGSNGAVKWTEGGLGKGSLMAADGKLIVLSEKGMLVVAAASPAGFKPISRAQVLGGKCWTTPVLSNGKIYCRNARGDLVCVDVSGK
ncbi:MAG: PQQ-like beta-propeller repeat protein [Verrucomicrobia bacterium]|nr:PQQ-like beta-propeller repeat protein [Verrucomicrobiota bacterium]